MPACVGMGWKDHGTCCSGRCQNYGTYVPGPICDGTYVLDTLCDISFQKYTEYLDKESHSEKCKLVRLIHRLMYDFSGRH